MSKKLIAALGLGLSLAFTAPSTSQAQPVLTGGLVNVTVTNVLNNNEVVKNVNVAIPINAAVNLAANVCGVAVNVISTAIALPGSSYTCTSTANGSAVTLVRQ